MKQNSKINVADHKGLVRSATVRKLTGLEYGNLILRASTELALVDESVVTDFLQETEPANVITAGDLCELGWAFGSNLYCDLKYALPALQRITTITHNLNQ